MLKIITGKNNPILKRKSRPIKKIDDGIKQLAENMLEIMKKNDGIGLSACQVGKNIRMFVLPNGLLKKWVFINPEIIKSSKKTDTVEEGCLSLPGIFVSVERSKSIKVKAMDENGKKFTLRVKGLPARVIQHENDHLDGVLITDYK